MIYFLLHATATGSLISARPELSSITQPEPVRELHCWRMAPLLDSLKQLECNMEASLCVISVYYSWMNPETPGRFTRLHIASPSVQYKCY